MKEFTDKLISRLEETGTWHSSICNDDIYSPLQKITVGDAIQIANQLAEEYNNDFCEWEIGEYGDSWKPNCCDDVYNLLGIRKFKHCPYCGKKIKVAPYQPKGE